MITVRCPNCEATYNVDEAKLANGGRKLKCAQCQTVWTATLPEEAPVAVEIPAVEEVSVAEAAVADAPVNEGFAPPADDMLVQRTPGTEAVVRVGGWRQWVRGENLWRSTALGVIIVGLLAGVGVVWMKMGGSGDEPMPSEHAEAHGGEHGGGKHAAESDMVKPPEGVVLHRVRGDVAPLDDGKGVALTVRGLLTNTTSATLTVPALQLELLDEDGQVADKWPVSGVPGIMEPNAEQAWTVSLSAPDMSAIKGWRVVFVKSEPADERGHETQPEAEHGADELTGH